jgi:hypothetical protein
MRLFPVIKMKFILAGLIVGGMTNIYLNLSIFLAFATMFPDVKVLLLFIIPVKVKWLGLAEGVLLILMIAISPLYQKVAIVVAILNYLLFFGHDLIRIVKNTYREYQWKKGNYN